MNLNHITFQVKLKLFMVEPVCHGDVCSFRSALSRQKKDIPVSKVALSIFLLLLAILMLDMSGGRLRYHYLLASTLRPMKLDVQSEIYEYHGSVPDVLQNCHAYDRDNAGYVYNCTLAACEQNAFMLSEHRQDILTSVRAAHPISRIVAEIFDHNRGVDQETKIERLFARKSCEGVIASSDRTNWKMDLAAVFTFPLGLYVLFKSFRVFLSVFVGHKVD